ncbi:MAG: UDP-N-acetylglucosamine 1-carboxyvinyltransferase [Ruminococcaceae bacterium]|nr:UDP-N-acetylglucosamine 1-carboxyvinyltransferase [Oscillospiraceae bacterium]
MKKIKVKGGNILIGDVHISGMKNAALPILFACILNKGVNVLYNLPPVSDIALSLEILEALGAKVTNNIDGSVVLDTSGVRSEAAPYEYVSRMRGSSYLIGAMLARFGEARVGMPGGCDFGDRPIDQHIKGFVSLGASISFIDGVLCAQADDGLVGSKVYLDMPSVGATANIIIASVFAKGTTEIMNAAREPHIVDLANFLNRCGADIRGAGTETVRIRGVRELHPCRYSISPDMIEAGTYMVAVATAGGCVNIKNVVPKHLEAISEKLIEMGVDVEVFEDSVTVTSSGKFRGVSVKTWTYPGLATDMQPQFGAMFCYAEGVSTVKEFIYEGRFKYLNELMKMGATISLDGTTARFMGGLPLEGCAVEASDLRAGAALVIAALAAKGTTEIGGVEYIERGYHDLEGKLAALGADISIIDI